MVRKSINTEILKNVGIDGLVSIDLGNLDSQNLQELDVWVDQYNHKLAPGEGIASSMLLTLLVLEEIVDDLISVVEDDVLDEQNSKQISDIKTSDQYFNDYTDTEMLSVVVLSTMVDHNQELRKIEHLSIASKLEEEQFTDPYNALKSNIREHSVIKEVLLSIKQHPDSLEEQLDALLQHSRIQNKFSSIILTAKDLIKEQTKFRGGGPGEIELPSYHDFYPESYTEDKDWMPKTVLLSKHIKVWLTQLSRNYDRSITTLDQIPDKELQKIVEQGFTGLWLIGIWQRSEASKKIKERMGNSDAAASAYSLWDYVIADDLGGHDAYYALSERAGKLGLRLASDMVPNHTGIMSKWVVEHPDWFIQTKDPPFSSYQFMSKNLADHLDVQIYLEDHYYSHSDAAVVFKRVDVENNDVRYIYHGNDGTSIPWNDTAQLDFLQQEVREAVINTILHVARMFPIIRLDAAMVLTKKHFQRLWYPAPGTGGDIPSRSRYGLQHEEFEQKFPVEFWREVVDRIEKEASNTLLIAEAFWMLEGYFVRTLGVHRVYNSAFMHMLRDQKNEEYRGLIKSTLNYDPRILQRYVNFMSNPDEDTAIEQFGRRDKYIGCAVMMVTQPGLPMFAHGQIEGFHEKYGMEFQKDYWQEEVDENLAKLHEQLIFPLLRKRYLFAQVKYFRLYDCYHEDGYVIEDIYAYTNRVDDELILVVYNNQMERAKGWIKTSLSFNANLLDIDASDQYQSSITEDISALPRYENAKYCLFRSFYRKLYFILTVDEIRNNGLFLQLQGYQFNIYSDFQLFDDHVELQQLYKAYKGQEIPEDDLPDVVQVTQDR